MTWKDNLRPASFRGVPFYVNSSDFGGGRRGQLHEYPLRDMPYFEDLGRKARAFSFDAFVVGADYMSKRDALISAIEESGDGQLVHPFYGSKTVICQSFRVYESKRDGGSATFSFEFVEAGTASQPVASSDRVAQVKSAADAFDLAAAQAFADSFISSGFPSFVTATSEAIAASSFGSMLSLVTDSELADRISAFVSDVDLLISSQLSFALLATGIIGDFQKDSAAPSASLVGLTATDETATLEAVPRETAARIQETKNSAAMSALIRRSAFSATARDLSDSVYASAEDAQAAMIDFSDRFDAEIERENVSDSEYTAARSLSAKVIDDLTSRLGGLPRVRTVTIPAPRPAVVVAYDLYEDATRDAEIVARNSIVRPGFMPAGEPIKVLSE